MSWLADCKDGNYQAIKEEGMPKVKEAKPRSAKKDLPDVVASIRPLPDDIGPSKRFMEEMRLRILDLQQAKQNPPRAA